MIFFKKNFACNFIILFTLVFAGQIVGASNITPETLEKTKRAIVTIDTRASIAAYNMTGSWTGTGFIADKLLGLIVTNAHVVGEATVGNYFVTFHNGQQLEAKLVYYDLWQDFAVLKVDSENLPKSVTEIMFSDVSPKVGDEVFIVGNNEGQSFSYHNGHLSDSYDINGLMSQHTYVVNLNSTGGSSGSPLLDVKGDAIGLHFAGSKTFALSVKGGYISYALSAIKKNTIPMRKHVGVLTGLYSLDKAERHRGIKHELVEEYLKQHPDCRNKVVVVKAVLNGSPAASILRVGDILWQINGKDIAASLFVLDDEMNRTTDNKVKLNIIRDGKMMEVDVSLYDINANKVERIASFGGAYVYEADDRVSRVAGVPLKSVTITNVLNGSSFSSIPNSFKEDNNSYYRLSLLRIADYPITKLDDLIDAISKLEGKKFIATELTNYQPYMTFSNTMISAHEPIIADIMLDNVSEKPRLIELNNSEHEWVAKDIMLSVSSVESTDISKNAR